MSELEDRINSVLSDPEQMDKIMGIARSLMGGAADTGEDERRETTVPGLSELGIDPGMLGRLSRIMGEGGKEKKQEQALLEAMKPYMSEKRRLKMDKALRLAKLARLAGFAMGEMGGERDQSLSG